MKTHKEVTLSLLRRGWTTALECAQQGGVYSLSQRVGDLRRAGVVVADKWITTPSGARIKAYRIAR
jgi:hypothetical protein